MLCSQIAVSILETSRQFALFVQRNSIDFQWKMILETSASHVLIYSLDDMNVRKVWCFAFYFGYRLIAN